MNHYQAVIIDDETDAAELLRISLQALFPRMQVQTVCKGWQEALQVLGQQSFDLVFLDIQMPGKNGIELIRLLPQIEGRIIFVTAYEEFALEAFKCYASGYLLKPVEDTALYTLVSRLLRSDNKAATPGEPEHDLLGIPGSKGIDYISRSDIIYLQAAQKCTRVVLRQGKILYSSYHLGRFRSLLPEQLFFQAHRSYIINLSAVRRYLHDHSGIIMADNTEIPVARPMREELMLQFPTLTKNPDTRK
jgi:two-component system, LytTR family, response regulator